MTDVALTMRQVGAEQKMFWRNPRAAMFSFVLPLLFLVAFATFNGSDTVDERGGLDYTTFLLPGILALGVMVATYQDLAITITMLRDQGVLKRIRGTPLPAWAWVGGRLGSNAITSFVLVALTSGIGIVFYDVEFRTDTLAALVVTLLLGALCFSALGLAVTTIIPNGEAAPAVANALLLPLVFISGIFFPSESAPDWLNTFTKVFPVQHFGNALQVAFDPRTDTPGFNGADLAVMGLWTVFGVFVALRFFKWESGRS